jgi:hypothetical protein
VARSFRPVPPYHVTLLYQVGLPHGDRSLHLKGIDRRTLILSPWRGTPRATSGSYVVIGGADTPQCFSTGSMLDWQLFL